MNDPENNPEDGLFSNTDDYINFSEVARDYPNLHETAVNSKEELIDILESMYKLESTIPVFLKDKDDVFHIITSKFQMATVPEGSTLIYMGKEIKVESE